MNSPDLLVGMETMDDAGVFRVTPDTAIVQTVDFFSPVVNDPRTFGRIGAANSLSDIWAMGARAVTAMNVLCYPPALIPEDVIAEILAGCSEKLVEAGVVLVGGHTMEQEEVVFGLSVTGVIHPDQAMRNSQARLGDKIVLTKRLGSGILSTAAKAGVLSDADFAPAIARMERLNMHAADVFNRHDVSAMTDVTGFGLLGHALAMVRACGHAFTVWAETVPVFQRALDLAEDYLPGGSVKNRQYVGDAAYVDDLVAPALADVLFDAQTSGGLIATVAPGEAEAIVAELHAAGDADATIIGEVTEGPPPGAERPVQLYIIP